MTIDPITLAAASGRLGAGGIRVADATGAGTAGAGGSADEVSDAFGLGRDDFFKLFLAQLRNQDPTQPFDDKEFLAQLAQFSLIDTLNDVKSALGGTQLAQASALIGRWVEGLADDGTTVSGVVDRIVQNADGITLLVGDQPLRPDNVSRVENRAP
jgi:flagellar basal-body rod modification protein FlgD